VCIGLDKLESDDEQTRLDALRSLDAHSDFGFTDTGMLVKRLPDMTKGSSQEASLRAALRDKADAIHREKLGKLESSAGGAAAKGGKFWTSIEGWIDFMDGAVRYRQSRQLVQDLIDFRVSHNKMAVEMRGIYARAKGGWLGKALAARLKAGRKQAADDEQADQGKDKKKAKPGPPAAAPPEEGSAAPAADAPPPAEAPSEGASE
jgi:hypothetical protein